MATLLEILLLNAAAAAALACLVWTAALLPAIRRRPALRYGLWMIVLVKLITPPIVELQLIPSWRQTAQTDSVDVSAVEQDIIHGSFEELALPVEMAPALPLELSAAPPPAFDWSAWLLAVHVTGVIVVLVLSLLQIRQLRRVLQCGVSAEPRLNGLVQQAAVAMRLARPPQVSIANAAVSPLLWVGRRGPLIVLPRGLLGELSDEQLSCVISHEMAHYLRRDHWGNAVSLMVAALFWWHPIVWWVRRELRTTQEACCDALVISRSVASRQTYAQTLFQALEFLQTRSAPVPALASGFGGKSSTQRRFEMIANPRVNHRLSWWNYLVLTAALAALPFWPTLSSAEEIALGDCPQAVQSTLEALQGAGRILKIERDADGEEQFYEVEVAINGKIYDVRVSGRGTLLSTVYSRAAGSDLEVTATITDSSEANLDIVRRPWHAALGVVVEPNDVPDVAQIEGEVIVSDDVEGLRRFQIMRMGDGRILREAAQDTSRTTQLQQQIERLLDQIRLLETSDEAQDDERRILRELVQTLQSEQHALAERQREMAQEAHEAQRRIAIAIVQSGDTETPQAVRSRQAAQQADARARLAGGLPEPVRTTLERESAGGSIHQITLAVDAAGTVTYTAQVQYETDEGQVERYEVVIDEHGRLLHKQFVREADVSQESVSTHTRGIIPTTVPQRIQIVEEYLQAPGREDVRVRVIEARPPVDVEPQRRIELQVVPFDGIEFNAGDSNEIVPEPDAVETVPQSDPETENQDALGGPTETGHAVEALIIQSQEAVQIDTPESVLFEDPVDVEIGIESTNVSEAETAVNE